MDENWYNILFTNTAKNSFELIPKSYKVSIIEKIKLLAINPLLMSNVKKLVDNDIAFRLRVGNYRILFERDDLMKNITIIDILHRKDAYRRH